MRYLIGIDIGTSATKTILMDEEGNVAAQAVRDYPLYQPDNGWAEQAPEDWQQAALETLKQVVEQSGVNRDDIQGIGLSGQMHGLVMLDEAGNPIRRSIIWMRCLISFHMKNGWRLQPIRPLRPGQRQSFCG